MTPRPATLERIFFILALLATSLDAAPMFGSSFDVGKPLPFSRFLEQSEE